ncbi:hypothetical protein EJ110_NYTH48451 [Nymphaea thermarum]|nr:hypothetical protein EJ110_NYTH48451 [Nymphaea thermarum]
MPKGVDRSCQRLMGVEHRQEYHGPGYFPPSSETARRRLLDDARKEVEGQKNVIQIVTDNGSNYKKAKLILEERYSNIFTTSCAAHCIALMLEDIDTLKNVASTMTKARQIVKFIYNKQQALDIIRTYKKGKELKRLGATRFASHFIYLHSILKQEENLWFMVASNDGRHVEEVEKMIQERLHILFKMKIFGIWEKK